ncbi:MAG TPA: hypothetical protein VLF18_15240 [Tahibacter sp.]|uniref:hypothetical protein n=1 Tax=Tahibacter sp. TaxID=2056211 RepID=UPI002BC34E37|nr:hypothetical protein [Tahibacter sp.]HSX61555.1 hypothetical protein [Tahibacter sp.]
MLTEIGPRSAALAAAKSSLLTAVSDATVAGFVELRHSFTLVADSGQRIGQSGAGDRRSTHERKNRKDTAQDQIFTPRKFDRPPVPNAPSTRNRIAAPSSECFPSLRTDYKGVSARSFLTVP